MSIFENGIVRWILTNQSRALTEVIYWPDGLNVSGHIRLFVGAVVKESTSWRRKVCSARLVSMRFFSVNVGSRICCRYVSPCFICAFCFFGIERTFRKLTETSTTVKWERRCLLDKIPPWFCSVSQESLRRVQQRRLRVSLQGRSCDKSEIDIVCDITSFLCSLFTVICVLCALGLSGGDKIKYKSPVFRAAPRISHVRLLLSMLAIPSSAPPLSLLAVPQGWCGTPAGCLAHVEGYGCRTDGGNSWWHVLLSIWLLPRLLPSAAGAVSRACAALHCPRRVR